MGREIVDNVLSGTKAGFKATLNLVFNQKAERSTLNRQKSRGLVENVLLGMKAGFKSILNIFKHPNGESRMFNLKSSSKLSATLLALIMGASVFMAGQVWAAKYVTDPTTGEMVEAPRYGGTLTFARKEEFKNADVVAAGAWGAGFVDGVLEKIGFPNWGIDRDEFGFVGLNAPVFAMTGQLAESWEQPDPLTIILNIRQGVHWHDKAPMNGRELTAKDVEYNFHRMMGLGSGFTELSPKSQLLKTMSFESIEATDKWTVVFKLKKPHLQALAGILDDWLAWIYPPEVIEQYGDASDWRNLVGTGPFMLTDWVEGSSITWTKNPDYWGYDEKYPQNRLPYVDGIRAPIMPEVATSLAALRTGKLDLLRNIRTVDQVESLQKTNPELVIWTITPASTNSTGLNVNKPPFTDIRVRKAMQMALDLETIQDAFFKGYGDTTPHGQVGDGMMGYFIPFEEWPEELKKVYDYDPAGAEALLDAAGLPRGADGIRFKTVYIHLDRYDANFTELLASYWNKIGVDVEVQVQPIAPFVTIRRAGDFEMISHEMAYGSAADPLNPPGRYTAVSWNTSAVNDPDYEAMFEAAGAATTIEEQQRLVKAMDMYAVERHWAVWSLMNPVFDAIWPWVKGYNGEFGLGYLSKNQIFGRLWIDQDLKKEMGH